MPLSVVIITKNEAHIIDRTLSNLQSFTDDVIVVDSGSTDGTVAIAKSYNATVIETTWQGYGPTKNIGIDAAKHDWILSLDADEIPDETLVQTFAGLPLQEEDIAYNLRFKTFFCDKWIRFGEWRGDEHIRLFNKRNVRWNDAAVHESLLIPPGTAIVTLKGFVQHYTVSSLEEYGNKMVLYAKLNAEKYYKLHKRSGFIQLWLSPVFTFLQHYIFRLGFLDGREGFIIAKMTARYTHLKYRYLKAMNGRREK